MKAKLIKSFGLLLSVICCLNAAAQSGSTEANPKWYYIQVKGVGSLANRVLTEINGQVSGRPIDLSDIDALSKQLWRFEIATGLRYKVINKYSKKQLTVELDAASGLRRPALVDDSPTTWAFDVSTPEYKLMRITNEPQDGKAGEIYLSQQGAVQQYVYKLTKLTAVNDSMLFRFALNEVPIISTDKATVWMNIRNPKTGKYLTDAVSSAPGMNFTLETLDAASQAQQWKIIDKGNGKREFVNRATGNMIVPGTHPNKYYYVNYTSDLDESAGWQYVSTSAANQYAVYSTDPEGVISYWNATTDGDIPLIYSAETAAGSAYAWTFSWVEEIRTGIDSPAIIQDNIRVYAKNRRICVEGCDEYRITSISGLSVRKNVELPHGVYLVTVKGKTTKILIK